MSPASAADPEALEAADRAAQVRPSAPDSAVAPCPFRFAMEVQVFDEDGQPLVGIPVEVSRASGEALRSKSDREGLARFEGLEDKAYSYSLYSLSSGAWRFVRSLPLDQPASTGGAAHFQSLPPADGDSRRHKVLEGECGTKLADRYGFGVDEIRAANERLAPSRGDLNMLVPGDEIAIPARSLRMETGNARYRHEVRRLAPLTNFRVRFLDEDANPRIGLKFLLSVETLSKKPAEGLFGETSGEGIIDVKVPCDTATVTITLGQGPEQEVHVMRISQLEPPETPHGLQARLNNLGYDCGDESGVIGPRTRAAVTLFQLDLLMEPSGEADKATLAALVKMHMS